MNALPDSRPLILIVDDTPTNLGVLVELLSAHHFAVSVAEDGESALELVEYIRPDPILLDVLMPLLDGYATCERLKALPATRDIPVVFMTGYSDYPVITESGDHSIARHRAIMKPFRPSELLVIVREVLDDLEGTRRSVA